MTTYTLTELTAILEAHGEDASEWIDGVFDSVLSQMTVIERLEYKTMLERLMTMRNVGISSAKETVIKLGLLLSKLGA